MLGAHDQESPVFVHCSREYRSGKQEARSTRDRLRPPNKALAGSALAARAGESDRAGTPVVRQPLTNENPTATSVRQGSAPYFFGTPRDAKDGAPWLRVGRKIKMSS